MTEKHYQKRQYRCICYEKNNSVCIYNGKEKIFDVSYRDYADARYLRTKLAPIIDLLNTQHDTICENTMISDNRNLNQVFALIDVKIEDLKPFDKGIFKRALNELKMEIKGDIL